MADHRTAETNGGTNQREARLEQMSIAQQMRLNETPDQREAPLEQMSIMCATDETDP